MWMRPTVCRLTFLFVLLWVNLYPHQSIFFVNVLKCKTCYFLKIMSRCLYKKAKISTKRLSVLTQVYVRSVWFLSVEKLFECKLIFLSMRTCKKVWLFALSFVIFCRCRRHDNKVDFLKNIGETKPCYGWL